MDWRARAVRGRLELSRPARTRHDDGRGEPSAALTHAPTTAPSPQPPPGRSRRRFARIALAPTAWAAWRLARSGYWNDALHERRGIHASYWEALATRRHDGAGDGNGHAEAGTELLFVAIGDSTAQGIGARAPAGSYVGQLERLLDGRLRVVNLSISGARLADVISALLPRLAELDTADALVTFAAGANNIESFDPDRFRADLATIFDALPGHALVAELPSFYFPPHQSRVRAANAILHALADERDLAVVPLFHATNRRGPVAIATHHAADLFHPNDRGYRVWAGTFLGPAAARLEEIERGRAASTAAG